MDTELFNVAPILLWTVRGLTAAIVVASCLDYVWRKRRHDT